MALDFPLNPVNNQIYGEYYYDAANASWRSNPSINGPSYISETAPAGVANGAIWYNSVDGTLFINYAGQWVEARSDQKVIPGSVIQVVSSVTTNSLTGTLGGAFNPTSTDGTQFHSFSFTPKFSNSKILLQSSNVVMGEYANATDEYYMAAYYDTTRIAIVAPTAGHAAFASGYNVAFHSFNHMFDSWGTSTKTIQVRVGSYASNVGSMYVNTNYYYNTFAAGTRNVSFSLMEVAQ